MDLANHAIVKKDYKGFDATTRGIAALEKATASASGEARRVDISATLDAQANVDVRALVGAILEHLGTKASE